MADRAYGTRTSQVVSVRTLSQGFGVTVEEWTHDPALPLTSLEPERARQPLEHGHVRDAGLLERLAKHRIPQPRIKALGAALRVQNHLGITPLSGRFHQGVQHIAPKASAAHGAVGRGAAATSAGGRGGPGGTSATATAARWPWFACPDWMARGAHPRTI
eukprot:gene22347-42618_t